LQLFEPHTLERPPLGLSKSSQGFSLSSPLGGRGANRSCRPHGQTDSPQKFPEVGSRPASSRRAFSWSGWASRPGLDRQARRQARTIYSAQNATLRSCCRTWRGAAPHRRRSRVLPQVPEFDPGTLPFLPHFPTENKRAVSFLTPTLRGRHRTFARGRVESQGFESQLRRATCALRADRSALAFEQGQ
jgi:hypothetical protein